MNTFNALHQILYLQSRGRHLNHCPGETHLLVSTRSRVYGSHTTVRHNVPLQYKQLVY